MARPRNVLFLCTGNSARSILAEALLNHLGEGRFRGWSAGSFPTGRVNPLALEMLAEKKIPAPGARSKSWDEFAQAGGVAFDYIITVCDNAAGEVCPVWPGQPVTAHWGIADPAAVAGSDAARREAFDAAFRALERRIRGLTDLSPAALERLKSRQDLERIGLEPPSTDEHPAG